MARKQGKRTGGEYLDPKEPYTKLAGFSATTIPALFVERCRATPDKVAFRAKEFGIYQEVTWREYRENVENFCLGLVEMGFKAGDTLAIMGDPCPAWVYADIAAE
ncbi:MAG: AMP-binding protein, partial [Dehalococcoidia bacterium]